MRAVVQRALQASVKVDGQVVGEITRPGLVALVGVHKEDGPADAQKIAQKLASLRILEGDVSVVEAGAPILVVSQFTLYGKTKKGTKPSWSDAAAGPVAQPLVDQVVRELDALGVETATGQFGAMMNVSLVNNGPFTVIVETR